MSAPNCGGEQVLAGLLPEVAAVDGAVLILKGFADPTRLRILALLRAGEVCVHDIVEALQMTQSAISHQLRLLRDARLVLARREGRHVFYRLADLHVERMLADALLHGSEAADGEAGT
jgi:ArsR family transcriptional regulator